MRFCRGLTRFTDLSSYEQCQAWHGSYRKSHTLVRVKIKPRRPEIFKAEVVCILYSTAELSSYVFRLQRHFPLSAIPIYAPVTNSRWMHQATNTWKRMKIGSRLVRRKKGYGVNRTIRNSLPRQWFLMQSVIIWKGRPIYLVLNFKCTGRLLGRSMMPMIRPLGEADWPLAPTRPSSQCLSWVDWRRNSLESIRWEIGMILEHKHDSCQLQNRD